MSTNKSQHLKLHLWEPQDNFLRAEFNENFAAIDSNVKAAQTAADNAQKTADTPYYVVGHYMGQGAKSIEINIGFRPSIVLIFTNQAHTSAGSTAGKFAAFGRIVTSSDAVTITDTGFRVNPRTSSYPDVNNSTSSSGYEYIAFR